VDQVADLVVTLYPLVDLGDQATVQAAQAVALVADSVDPAQVDMAEVPGSVDRQEDQEEDQATAQEAQAVDLAVDLGDQATVQEVQAVDLAADSVDPAQEDMAVVPGSVDHQEDQEEDQATAQAAQEVDLVDQATFQEAQAVGQAGDSVDPAQVDMALVLDSVDPPEEDQATAPEAQAVGPAVDLVVTLYPPVDLGDQATVQAAQAVDLVVDSVDPAQVDMEVVPGSVDRQEDQEEVQATAPEAQVLDLVADLGDQATVQEVQAVDLAADSVDPAQVDMAEVPGSVDHQEDQATVLEAQAVDPVLVAMVVILDSVDPLQEDQGGLATAQEVQAGDLGEALEDMVHREVPQDGVVEVAVEVDPGMESKMCTTYYINTAIIAL